MALPECWRCTRQAPGPLLKTKQSCVVFGMPREAINMGGVSEVVDLSQVSQQMLAKISAGQAIRI
ncbi:protein-glutamate methylesterase [Salmonella enterica subsp. arizonae]|uniref:Protein-glutamate methylesterase n=1 Tax=Salmonella enterica subsp. arizonae TaxID=59203 RepID=A0A379S206_SALER|nr:protein-glutamate methylesterase [Salmonella enterica subsp. arizonae]